MTSGGQLTGAERAALAGEYANMLACVRCGACLTSCPTYVLTSNEAEGPRGRVAMVRALLEDSAELTPDFLAHEASCLVCDACSGVCPAGVSMERLQVSLRAVLAARQRQPAWLGLAFRVFGSMAAFRSLVRAARWYQRSGLRWLARHLGLLKLLGLEESDALLPSIPGEFLVPQGQVFLSHRGGERVQLFAGCIMSTALADVDRATIRVLQRAGCDVEVTRGQGCCGALNAHGGDVESAKELARQNIAAFAGDAPIIVNSAGCGAMLKEYGHLLGSAEAQAFAARVKDVTEFLACRDLPLGRVEARAVAYQDACHLAHAQGIRRQPRELLKGIQGIELRELADGTLCCGSAGIYNLTHPEEARELQRRKVEAILKSGAREVATANPGCLLQLRAGLAEAGSHIPVRHIVELLDEAAT